MNVTASGFSTRILVHLHDRKPVSSEIETNSDPIVKNPASAWTNMTPLNLLNLPLDILQSVIKEIPYTNDLAALALTCSSLHEIVVPHIYARFDIVWPDDNRVSESKAGVDALTYGLSTLAMSPETFGQAEHCHRYSECRTCGTSACTHNQWPQSQRSLRRGNHFALYTRKFSLGNGPQDWVDEYLINQESGKMLGTLAAIAVGRMRNLELFHWDMPTGIVRDIWLALASLSDRDDGKPCKLESVWIRWHDSRKISSLKALSSRSPMQLSAVASTRDRTKPPRFAGLPHPYLDFPTFSTLSPMKALSVLDIDTLAYAEEMSVLIGKSLTSLRELRVGIAKHAIDRPGPMSHTLGFSLRSVTNDVIDLASTGGLLAVLFSHTPHDVISSCTKFVPPPLDSPSHLPSSRKRITKTIVSELKSVNNHHPIDESQDFEQIAKLFAAHGIDEPQSRSSTNTIKSLCRNKISASAASDLCAAPLTISDQVNRQDNRGYMLQLEVLELERLYLSMSILRRCIDWCALRSLTLLGCENTESLWRALRKAFGATCTNRVPVSNQNDTPSLINSSFISLGSAKQDKVIPTQEYHLRLKALHIDTVSAALLAFIRDSLPPDTLEVLFLQNCGSQTINVTLEQIYRCAVRRHRGSLQKLLINSNEVKVDGPVANNWRQWYFNRELLTCVINPRLHLRELSLALDHKDWHYLLQRLPELTSLRSLHITNLANYLHGRVDCREAAQQIADVVAYDQNWKYVSSGFIKRVLNSSRQVLLSTDQYHSNTFRQATYLQMLTSMTTPLETIPKLQRKTKSSTL